MRSRNKTVFAVVAFVAIIAVVGFMTFSRYEKNKEKQQAQVEKPDEREEETYTTNNQNVEAEIEIPQDITEDIKEDSVEEVHEETVTAEIPEEKEEEFTFSKEETLLWPIDGNVILNYSMDQTIYFATLDQYKYNPALVISGELGAPVVAAADGKVIGLGGDARLGNTITVDMGNGYQTIYGQLQEIRVIEGEKIYQGDVIGYVEEPTKYYTVEGPNVYFQLLKDGEPENPLEYMEE